MAKETVVYRVDDLNGTKRDVESVVFSLDGFFYEIELSAANRKRLRKALDKFITAGRIVHASTVLTDVRETSLSIRQWAHKKGYDVGARGRLRQEIVDAYNAENGQP